PSVSCVPTVLEILQLVNHRDLLLADTHILELERECEVLALLPATPASTPTSTLSTSTPPLCHSLSFSSYDEVLSSNATLDSSRRKAKDVELLYEALQKEMWDVVRESLRQPSAGPNLGLVVLVIQQEEHADAAWAVREETRTERVSTHIQPSQRPRRLKTKWRHAVAEAAEWSLPHQVDTQAGQLALYLERLRSRMVDDLDAARRNAVSIYPEEFAAFQVYVESYHQAVAKRLRTITSGPLQITDVYSLLEWFYNIYNRLVMAVFTGCIRLMMMYPGISNTYIFCGLIVPKGCAGNHWHQHTHTLHHTGAYSSSTNSGQAGGRLHQYSQELIQVLDEEERRWAQTLYIEEYQSNLARSVIQKKVEMFHDTQAEFGDRGDGYVSRTIALVNCCPPLRYNDQITFYIVLLTETKNVLLTCCLQPFFDKLMKRKWLNNTEAFEAIEASIKQHFRKFKRMDPPPYQALVGEVHRRVLVEYVRAVMRGRIICTSSKMRKRMAFRLQDEAKQLKGLFRDLLFLEISQGLKKHVSTLLNVRGMTRQAERQEILNVVKDFECSSALICRERALFADIPITSEVHCISLGLMRLAMTVSNWFSEHRPRRRRRTSARNAAPQTAETTEDASKLHREE
ncbi:hypothetical protein GOODEAATRI_021055, partial [Goodea atripinnis]